jgi:hypothetical protein
MKILNLKMPFLVLCIIAYVIFIGNITLAEHYFLNSSVLGARSSNEKKRDVVSRSKSNRELDISKVKNISIELKKASKRPDVVEDTELNSEINDVAKEIDTSIARGVVHVKKVQSRSAWKRFLFGPDYKNLGQLRSGLVHMDNGIKKLEKTIEKSEGGVSDSLEFQLKELVGQREGIVTMIRERESGFSLFGWVSKLLTGYQGGVIEDIEIDTGKTDIEIEDSVEESQETIDTEVEVQEQEEVVVDETDEDSEADL